MLFHFRMSKIIKCAGNNDVMTLKAEDDGDVLNMVFESTNGERYFIYWLKNNWLDSLLLKWCYRFLFPSGC